MSRVFVEERDTFLAYSLQQAAEAPFQNGSGLTDPPVVVGVVGIGHVAGIVQKFDNVQAADVAKVIRIPVPSRTSIFVKRAIKGMVWGLTAYGLYKVFMRSSVAPKLLSRFSPAPWINFIYFYFYAFDFFPCWNEKKFLLYTHTCQCHQVGPRFSQPSLALMQG